MSSELLKGNTPTLILTVLADGPQHGYAIASEIQKRSGDILKFKHGTLYPALHALELDGMIVGEWQTAGSDRPRRVYRISENGTAELAKRTKAWREFSTAIDNVIGRMPNEQPA